MSHEREIVHYFDNKSSDEISDELWTVPLSAEQGMHVKIHIVFSKIC